MIVPRDYPNLLRRGKAIQRDQVVRIVFGGQTRLAAILGVRPSTVNHVIWLRKRSRRIERFVVDRVRAVRPDLAALWQESSANGKRKVA